MQVALEACTGWLFVSRALAARRCSPASRRAGRDERAARAQAPGEDRSRGRALAAHAARRGTAARILDPAGTRRGSGARARGCARRSSTSARSGCSASRRRCFTTASVALPDRAAQRPPDASSSQELELPADARERIAIALAMIDSLDGQLRPLECRASQTRAPADRLPCADGASSAWASSPR